MTTSPSPVLLYARQFIAGPSRISGPNLAQHNHFDKTFVSSHASLAVTKMATTDCELLCLGHVIDPKNPRSGNAQVLAEVLTHTRSFTEFERAIADLSGRWLLFVKLADGMRLYPDAAGSKSAFYTQLADRRLWIASQPGLLSDALGIAVDEKLRGRLRASSDACAWPAESTPYPNVQQLLPNHYLDLHSGQVRRFWPSVDVRPVEVHEAVASIRNLLRGTMEGAVARGAVAMPLTGG